ncbi:hypothetical protein ACIBH1_42945 [Nonomuraea sp. NPDC050663]|uniref:hypothetical protein n=1 Tax=Nonomuraea sp. NPDC050663 TaxID=3364370 RepID=UPI0037B4F183
MIRLVQLSATGQALALYWTINAQTMMGYAAGRSLIALFDPMAPATMTPETEYAWLDQLPVARGDRRLMTWQSSAFAAAESRSGIRLDRHWWGQEHLSLTLGSIAPRQLRRLPRVHSSGRSSTHPRRRSAAAGIVGDPDPGRLHDLIRLVLEPEIGGPLLPADVLSEEPLSRAWELISSSLQRTGLCP